MLEHVVALKTILFAYFCSAFISVVQWLARLSISPRARVRIPAQAVAAIVDALLALL